MWGDSVDKARSMTARLLGLLTFALFPLALISLYQTQAVVNEAEELSRIALRAETERAAINERKLLEGAFGAASALGSVVSGRGDTSDAACDAVLSDFIDRNPNFVFAGFIAPSGMMECASRGDPVDFSQSPDWSDAVTDIRPRLQANASGAVTKKSVLIVSQPIFTEGRFAGYMSISIPHDVSEQVMPQSREASDFWLVTLHPDGSILSASGDEAGTLDIMPAGVARSDLFGRVDAVFNAESAAGPTRKYAVIPIFEGTVHALGSWPLDTSSSGPLGRSATAPLAFPILMWLVGIAVAWLGLHNLVIRHIRALRDAMRRFALGERNAPQLSLPNPPEELAQAERSFNRMVKILTETEERREADLHDKTVLLREVHHRVKNNLQLIASITNLQMRHVKAPETRRVLAQLQRRVRGLATIHQKLYTTPDLTTVDARDLVESMVAQMDQIGGRTSEAPVVTTQLDSALLYPDQAVPLSMLLAEALNNAWKYAGGHDGKKPTLDVRLSQDQGDNLRLVIENSCDPEGPPPGAAPGDGDGLGTTLMAAFVSQLEGISTVDQSDRHYRLTVEFDAAPFGDHAPT